MQGNLCDVAKSLENDIVKIGQLDDQKLVLGKPFPLTLVPAENTHVNFILLQEYFL